MKLLISGNLTKEDLIEIGKFFRNRWKDRKDVISIIVTEGLESKSKEETVEILREIFKESKHYTEIIIEK